MSSDKGVRSHRCWWLLPLYGCYNVAVVTTFVIITQFSMIVVTADAPPLFNEHEVMPLVVATTLQQHQEHPNHVLGDIRIVKDQPTAGINRHVDFQSTTIHTDTDTDTTHRQDRNLFLFGSVTGSICSLTSDQFVFVQDPTTQLYIWNGDTNRVSYNDVNPIWTSTVLDQWNASEQIQQRTSNWTNTSSVAVRACLCTGTTTTTTTTSQYTNPRPIQFCSAEFRSCSIGNEPIQCRTVSSTDTFVQSFWPISVFWMFALLCIFTYSDPGRNARQYYQRKVRCSSTRRRIRRHHHRTDSEDNNLDGALPTTNTAATTTTTSTDDEIAQQQLDMIVEQYPSRIGYMYREYMNRFYRDERNELRRQNSQCRQTCYTIRQSILQCMTFGRYNTDNNNNYTSNTNPITTVTTTTEALQVPETTTGENDQVNLQAASMQTTEVMATTAAAYPRLLLKTKVFSHSDAIRTVGEGTPMTAGSTGTDQDDTETNDDDGIDGPTITTTTTATTRCAICLLRLLDGIDIVGDLPCQHFMHKQCLKDWLKRKNRCPLCQLTDIAIYQSHEPQEVLMSPQAQTPGDDER
jgi:Ring finger domain